MQAINPNAPCQWPTYFGPDLKFLGPRSSMLCGSDVIAAEVEEVIDLIVG